MSERWSFPWVAALAIVFLTTMACGIDSAAGQEKPAADAANGAPATQPTAEEIKLTKPGPEHEYLKALVGEFDGDYEIFPGPDAPVQRAKGKITNKLVYGGRFLEGHYEEDVGGEHFTGQNLIGYDNFKKRYVGTWVSSGLTNIVYAEGTADAEGKVITLEFEDKDQDPAHPVRIRLVTTIIDKDHYSIETICIIPNSKTFTVARTLYKRR